MSEATEIVRKLRLHPHDQPCNDGHHTDVDFTEGDELYANLAWYLGCIFSDVQQDRDFMYKCMTSHDMWKRIARALRVHGLKIVDI